MVLSATALTLLMGFEGLRLEAYKDAVGVWTIGYGHTALVQEGNVITKEQAIKYLRMDVERAERAVRAQVEVPLTQGQFDALVSFSFNLGPHALHRSTLRKKLNQGDYSGAAEEFSRWVYAGGKSLKGLIIRRAKEKELFLS